MKSCFVLLMVALTLGVVQAEDSYVLTYSGPNIGNSSANARKMFENVSLSDYQARVAVMGDYAKYRGNTTYVNGAGRFVYMPVEQTRSVVSGRDRLTVLFSAYEKYTGEVDSTYQLSVILEQREDDIYGWINDVYVISGNSFWAYWANGADYVGVEGREIKHVSGAYDLEDKTTDEYPKTGGTFIKGWSVDFLRLDRIAGPTVAAGTTETVSGDLAVAADTHYVASGPSALANDEYAGNITVDGKLTVRDPGELTLSGTVSGVGDIAYEATTVRTDADETVYYGDSGTYLKTSWCTVAHGRLLSSVTNVLAQVGGKAIGSGSSTAKCYFLTNNGFFATCQVQRTGNWKPLRCVVVYLRQSGADIQAVASAAYQGPDDGTGTYRPGTDFFNPPEGMKITRMGNISTADSESTFGLKNFGLQFKAESAPQFVVSTGLNSQHTGSVVRVTGTATAPMLVDFATQADGKGLPAYGALEVGPGGHAVLGKEVEPKYVKAYDGGVVYQGSNNCFRIGARNSLLLDGGTFVAGYQSMNVARVENADDAFVYLNQVEFRNGGVLTGCKPRVGYGCLPCWRVSGTNGKPSVCSSGMSLFPKQNAAVSAVTLDVADVTGDDRTDFVMTAPVKLQYPVGNADYAAYNSQYFKKIGSGTFSMEASFTPAQPTVIAGGTWRIGSADAASAATAFKLEGGALEVASGLDVTTGEVTPSVPSEVRIGVGATLTIPMPTAAWPQGAKLNFIGADVETRGAVKVGDSACLDAALLKRFKINGHSVAQKEDGGLVRSDPGLVLFVR